MDKFIQWCSTLGVNANEYVMTFLVIIALTLAAIAVVGVKAMIAMRQAKAQAAIEEQKRKI